MEMAEGPAEGQTHFLLALQEKQHPSTEEFWIPPRMLWANEVKLRPAHILFLKCQEILEAEGYQLHLSNVKLAFHLHESRDRWVPTTAAMMK